MFRERGRHLGSGGQVGLKPPITLRTMVLPHKDKLAVLFSIVLKTIPPPPQSVAASYGPEERQVSCVFLSCVCNLGLFCNEQGLFV